MLVFDDTKAKVPAWKRNFQYDLQKGGLSSKSRSSDSVFLASETRRETASEAASLRKRMREPTTRTFALISQQFGQGEQK